MSEPRMPYSMDPPDPPGDAAVDPNDPSGDTFTIWHVVMDHATVTFLDYDMLKDFLSGFTLDKLRTGAVVCTSKVTVDEYNRMTDWNVGSRT